MSSDSTSVFSAYARYRSSVVVVLSFCTRTFLSFLPRFLSRPHLSPVTLAFFPGGRGKSELLIDNFLHVAHQELRDSRESSVASVWLSR